MAGYSIRAKILTVLSNKRQCVIAYLVVGASIPELCRQRYLRRSWLVVQLHQQSWQVHHSQPQHSPLSHLTRSSPPLAALQTAHIHPLDEKQSTKATHSFSGMLQVGRECCARHLPEHLFRILHSVFTNKNAAFQGIFRR